MGKNKIILGELGSGVALPDGGPTRVFLGMSLASDGLEIDTLTATKDLVQSVPTLFRPKDADGLRLADGKLLAVQPRTKMRVANPDAYQYGDIVTYARDNALFAKFHLKAFPLVWGSTYDLKCQSAVGILQDALQHQGGVYDGVTADWLIADIIADLVPYTLDPALKNEKLYGYLPWASRRDNLQQVLFALGANVFKDENGDMYIGALDPDSATAKRPIVYTAQRADADNVPAGRVTVLEHKFVALDSTEEIVLFDGEVPADTVISPVREWGTIVENALEQGSNLEETPNKPVVREVLQWVTKTGTLVPFDQPMQVNSLRVEGSEILVCGTNFAVLAPCGSCKLYGKPYTHITRQISRPALSAADAVNVGGKELTVKDATLVTMVNSENVADRVYAYYKNGHVIKADMVIDSERPGDKVAFTDAHGRDIQGIIKSMDINLSNTLKASVEVVTGYTHTGVGNFYRHFVLITSSCTYTVPAGVYKIRIVLGGGGDGGASGYPGEDGEPGKPNTSDNGASGAGGEVGLGGAGGKILIITLDVVPGQVFQVSIGAGGIGGVCDGVTSVPGTKGGDTTFGDYSSAAGSASVIGYVDILSGKVYGPAGEDGLFPGGAGNGPEGNGPTCGGALPGATGQTATGTLGAAGGGYGGGAAYGQNGADGTDGISGKTSSIGGDGGDGADAAPAEDGSVPGAGGQGGSGGGGGGGGGFANHSNELSSTGGKAGKGGLGGNGGDGADGFVGIYF